MTRAILLALLLAGCGMGELLPESGAPPRPNPPDMAITIGEMSMDQLRTFSRRTGNPDEPVLGLALRLHNNAGATAADQAKLRCRILIAKELTGIQRDLVLAHEMRHCAGQEHVIRNGVTVWLP